MTDPLPLDPSKIPQRVFLSQLIFSVSLGTIGFLAFCYLRQQFPQIYSLRSLRRLDIEPLPKTWFLWMKALYSIQDEDVLALSGLDAYVFLCFFRISIQIFALLTIISVVVIGPIRYYVTGYYDHADAAMSINPHVNSSFPPYLYVYALFTYIFILLSLYLLFKQTKKIVTVRQSYLGRQNSVTDRTIRVDGIPPSLRNPAALTRSIERLAIGKVTSVMLNKDWSMLAQYFKERRAMLSKLEAAYIDYLGLDWQIHRGLMPESRVSRLPDDSSDRPVMRMGFLGLTGPKVDTINYYLLQLKKLDYDIEKLREQNANFAVVDSAFVTMDLVAAAQMLAQAVLDPNAHTLISTLAPLPLDVIWESAAAPVVKKVVRNYTITAIFVVSSVVLIFPVSSLAALINLETISRFWPGLGRVISESKWLTTLVTGILPPTLFTLLNVCIPYLYSFLSARQYFCLHGDVELASVSKNFFYTFFNLFLVFTIAGSASNFWSYFTDTTKIALQLAESIKKLALFYTDLILLQGLGIFPYKLMQFGDVFEMGFYRALLWTKRSRVGVRKLRYLYYAPKIFDFGLILPQHILIFIIIMIYSIVSTKLLASGLVYFVLGYFVYKYQLVYLMIHPQHSTGKVWAMIIHRLTIGLFLFELTMIGTLALENAVFLAISLVPLIGVTIYFHYTFEKYYKPLLHYIALRVIKTPRKLFGAATEDAVHPGDVSTSTADPDAILVESADTSRIIDTVQQSLRKRRNTFDERKDWNQTYEYPYINAPLDGPWIGFKGNDIEMINHENCPLEQLLTGINEDVRIDVRKVDVDKLFDKISGKFAGESVLTKQIRVNEWE